MWPCWSDDLDICHMTKSDCLHGYILECFMHGNTARGNSAVTTMEESGFHFYHGDSGIGESLLEVNVNGDEFSSKTAVAAVYSCGI